MLKALKESHITFRDRAAEVNFSESSQLRRTFRDAHLTVEISSKVLDYFYEDAQVDWKDDINSAGPWLEQLRPFSAMKYLDLSKKAASRVAPALQELVEGRTIEVLPTILPALQVIFVRELELSGAVQDGIGQFVASRQVAGHPITVSRWE